MAKKKDSIKKVEVLNEATKKIRESILAIEVLYGRDADIEHYLWRANKHFGELVKAICKKLDQEVTNEAFQNIVRQLGEQK